MLTLPRLSELMLTEMATAWVNNEIFSDRHIQPRRDELIYAVFPAVKELMRDQHMDRLLRDECGLIFELMDKRLRDRSINATEHRRIYPVFSTCKIMHKDQIGSLQQAITLARTMRRKPLVTAFN